MAYRQDRHFDTAKAGKRIGWCLQNTRYGFDIAGKYPTAIAAWNNTVQHKDRNIPTGVDVPLFYTYKTDGHVNARLKNGHVHSDGVDYPSLADYEAKHPAVRYVGWGETLNDVPVIHYEADPVPVSTGQRLYFSPIGQTATFYKEHGGTYAMKIKDASYNWNVLENHGSYVVVNSASAGGRCRVYLTYTATGKSIPGRYVK